jgi:cell wall-associated NlpC family hydrolase
MLTTAVAFALSLTLSSAVLADPLSDRVNEQQNIINSNKSKVNEINKTTSDIESNIEALDDTIGSTNSQITLNKNKIALTQKEIDKAAVAVKAAQDKMDEEQELFNNRMRAIYIHGNDGISGYLTILLDSKGMGDFLSRVGTVKKLAELDSKILGDLKNQQNVVKKKKEAFDAEKTKLQDIVDDNTTKLAKLNTDKQTQLDLIAQSQKEASKYAAAINTASAEIKKIRESVPKYVPSRGAAPISSNSIVAYAYNFIGTKYVYGANGPDAFDCSGFTKYVFAHFGVTLNRVASDQASQGQAVGRGDLEPGDLVFFGSSNDISHVGIYVGNDCYIHAPHTGTTVQVSSMERGGYVTATRVK